MAYPSISTYIKDQMGHKDTVSTVFERSALLFKIAGKALKGGADSEALPNAKRLGGPDFTLKFRNTESVASMFNPGGTGDFIGASDPALGATATYGYRDPVVTTKAWFSYMKNPIRISKIEMTQAKNRQSLIPFLNEQLDAVEEDACNLLAQQIVNGQGDGQTTALTDTAGVTGGVVPGVATDMYGLIYQGRSYSGDIDYNTAVTSAATANTGNTHFGLCRQLYPQLVGNVADAALYEADQAALLFTTAGLGQATLTNGSTEITIPATLGTTVQASIGRRVVWDENGTGVFKPLGREWQLASCAPGAGQTKCQMTRPFEGTTGGYDVKIVPWFNSTDHGASGAMNVNKIIMMIDYVTNGNIVPDIAMLDSPTFSALRQTLQSQERYIEQNNKALSVMGYRNIEIAGVTFCVDNSFPTGEVHIYNSDYLIPYLEKGFDKLKLMEDELVEATDGRAVASLVGTTVTALQVVNLAPNTSAIIKNLSV